MPTSQVQSSQVPLQETSAEEIRRRVRHGYAAVAKGQGALAVKDAGSQALAFGYDSEVLAEAPQVANLGLGCGNPTGRAQLKAGDVVLDLGCGAGFDVFIASRAVGPTGRVVGVDMTAALIDQAKATAQRDGYDNVEFRLGMMESLPVEDSCIDVIVSNCAINLSPEKNLVFAEAVRVLRPGGRLQVSDLVVEQDLPAEIQASVEAYVGCVGGAISKEAYADLVHQAGFEDVEVEVVFALSDIVAPDDDRVLEVLADAGVSYPQNEILDALTSIKSLSVRARTKDTVGSCCHPTDPPNQSDQGTTDRGYHDLLSYVLSNAVAGEIMAVENYSDMVALFDTVDAKLEAVEQARDEGRHIRQLSSLGTRLGFEVKQTIIEPEWKAVRAAFREAVSHQDLAACLIIQDLMTESMAIVLYQALSGDQEVETDDLTASVSKAILADELRHLEIGIARLRRLREADPYAIDAALRWAHPRVMPKLFSSVSTDCETLCGDLGVDCGELDPSSVNADLDLIRARAATQYMEALEAVGFPSELIDPLMAQLASLEQDDAQSRVVRAPLSCC